MYTSDEKAAVRAAIDDALLTVFLACFGGVYELFSHGVYSYWMLYAFAVPLAGGVLPLLLLIYRQRQPSSSALILWHLGLVTLAVGAVMQGVVEIYGSTNRLIRVYPIAGGVLLLAGTLCGLLRKRGESRK